MPSTASRIVKNTGFLYARMGITMFISLWTTRLVLNALGSADYGIFAMVGGAISMLGFLNVSLANATQRFTSYEQGHGDLKKSREIFNVGVVLHFVMAILMVVGLIIFGFLLFNGILNIPQGREKATEIIYGSLIVSTAFTVMTVPYDAVMNAHENMKYYAVVGIFESILKLSVAYVTVMTSQDKLIVYGILMAMVPLVTLTIMRLYCHKYYPECVFRPSKYFSVSKMREMTGFAGWSFLPAMTAILNQYGLGVVLNHFYGALLNAAHGIADQLSGMLMAFCNGMLRALNPVIFKKEGAGQRDQMVSATLFGSKYSFVLIIVLAIPAILEMPVLLNLWLKSVPDWAILFCQLQLIRFVIEQLTMTMGRAVAAQGQIKSMSIIQSVLNILPITVTIILFIYHYPPYVMYITWIFFYSILGGFTMLHYAHLQCSVSYHDYFMIVLMPCVIMTVSMSLLGYLPQLLVSPGLLRLCITIVITTVVMIAALILSMKKSEKEVFAQMYSRAGALFVS